FSPQKRAIDRVDNGERGVVASQNLRKGEKLLFVPLSHVISADCRQQSLPTVKKRPKFSEQLTVQNQKRLASDQQSPQLECYI
ncbi:hypothetical protein IGI04_025701, partial [Brassica rapa subsp. trilocularis]